MGVKAVKKAGDRTVGRKQKIGGGTKILKQRVPSDWDFGGGQNRRDQSIYLTL